MPERSLIDSADEIKTALGEQNYIASDKITTIVYLSQRLGKPLLTEGPAGVGKTELAKVLASASRRELIRLQCYEGLDISSAVYEWNYPAQMLEIRLSEASGNANRQAVESNIFSEKYLIRRPVLQAISAEAGKPCDGCP